MKPIDFLFAGLENNTVRDQMDLRDTIGEGKHLQNSSQLENKYQCLLKCEGNKTYHKPGYCPDCNMKLVSFGDSRPQL